MSCDCQLICSWKVPTVLYVLIRPALISGHITRVKYTLRWCVVMLASDACRRSWECGQIIDYFASSSLDRWFSRLDFSECELISIDTKQSRFIFRITRWNLLVIILIFRIWIDWMNCLDWNFLDEWLQAWCLYTGLDQKQLFLGRYASSREFLGLTLNVSFFI